MDWTYNGRPFTPTPEVIEDYQGIVYELEEISTGKKYIGKKFFWSKRRLPPLKGKSRKRIVKKESDWRDYHGSSEEVKLLVEQGSDFARRILRLCHTKGDCSYWEAKLQFEKDVLLRDDYYNEFIGCKIHSKHLKK